MAEKITRCNRNPNSVIFIIMKDLIYQEDIEALNLYIPNNRASEYVKLKLID